MTNMEQNIAEPADLSQYYAEAEAARPRPARRYSQVAIGLSFLALWLGPIVLPNQMHLVLLGCLLFSAFDDSACLFLLIASSTMYFPDSAMAPSRNTVWEISPTRLAGAFLVLRCLVMPGFAGISKALGVLPGWTKWLVLFYVLLLIVGVFPAGTGRVLIAETPSVVFFVVAVTLASRINEPRRLACLLLLALALAAAYHVLMWTGLLAPLQDTYRGRIVEDAHRVGVGHYEVNYTGGVVAAVFVASIMLFLAAREGVIRFLFPVLAAVAFITLVQLGSRAGIVSAGLGAVIAMVLAWRERGVTTAGRSALLAVMAAVFVALFWAYFGGKLTYTVQSMGGPSEAGGESRAWLAKQALAWVFSHPLPDPTGWWQSMFIEAHNTWLTIGINSGPLAIATILGVVGMAITQSLRNRKCADPAGRVWETCLLVMLLTIMIDITTISTVGHKAFWTLLALCSLRRDTPVQGVWGHELGSA